MWSVWTLLLAVGPTVQAAEPPPQPPPSALCAALLTDPVDGAAAVNALQHVDPNERCSVPESYRVMVRPRPGELLFGMLLPPIGLLMLAGAEHETRWRTLHPAPLDLALNARDAVLVDALLDAGADPLLPGGSPAPVPLSIAIALDSKLGGTTWTDKLLRPEARVPADLLEAKNDALDALLDRPDLLLRLIDHGLDPQGRDAFGGTWITRALEARSADHLAAALALGADPNLAHGSRTPLRLAMSHDDREAFELLVRAGADPTLDTSDPAGLLAAAATKADTAWLERLLELGCPPDAAQPFGDRPLHAAIEAENTAAIEVLIAAGARPGRGDTSIFRKPSPFELAVEREDAALVARFRATLSDEEREDALVHAVIHDRWQLATDLFADGATGSEALWVVYTVEEVVALRELGARYDDRTLVAMGEALPLNLLAIALFDGADPRVGHYGETRLLQAAVEQQDWPRVALLVSYGMDPSARPWLQDALYHGRDEEVRTWLYLGATPALSDLAYVVDRGELDRFDLLLAHSAPLSATAWRRLIWRGPDADTRRALRARRSAARAQP